MKRFVLVAMIACLSSGVLADDKHKTPPGSIAVPEVDSLRWTNLKLDEQSRRNKAEALISQAEQIKREADSMADDIKVRLCKESNVDPADYTLQITQAGVLVLTRKPDPEKKEPEKKKE